MSEEEFVKRCFAAYRRKHPMGPSPSCHPEVTEVDGEFRLTLANINGVLACYETRQDKAVVRRVS